jgi:hypothetical protein
MKKIIFLLIIIVSHTACDLFTTRTGEIPDEGRSKFQPAVSREILIENLINSLSDKNVQNYISCFVDSFFASRSYVFSPSSEALSSYPFLSQDWGLGEEQRYFTSMVSKVSKDFPVTLTLSDDNFNSVSGDTSIYSATYFLNVPFSSEDPLPKNYSGSLQFNVMRDSRSEWVIYFWKDTKSQTLPSWSELKGSLN